MNTQPVLDWLGVRPAERRTVILAATGAGLVMAFFTLARALREALFLTAYPVESLPYIILAAAAATLPAVGAFSSLLARRYPRTVLSGLSGAVGLAVLVLWPFVVRYPAAVVVFYLITSVSALLVASGFWVVVADLFPVREAKRVYGLVTAGGTLGTLVSGLSISVLLRWLPIEALILLLAVLLGLFVLVLGRLPHGPAPLVRGPAPKVPRFPLRDALVEMGRTPHLCRIATLVLTATVASTLVDYVFKAQAQAAWTEAAALSSFLGAFYGWTGAAALLIQLVVAPRLMAAYGVGGSLAFLPAVLIAGGAAAMAAPGLLAATALRGADNTLRRALHRPVLEYLYVPLPPAVRRRTKTVIDTVADTLGESVGAAIVLVWLSVADWSLQGLLTLVVLLGAVMLLLGRRMAAEYARSVLARLHEAVAGNVEAAGQPLLRDLFTASFTRTDLNFALDDAAVAEQAEVTAVPPPAVGEPPASLLERLQSPDNTVARSALEDLDREPQKTCRPEPITAAVKLLARDPLRRRAAAALVRLQEAAVPAIIAALQDQQTRFAVRRRLPTLLASMGGPEADDALLEALGADRFEVRYRAAVALGLRRRGGLPGSKRDWQALVWDALATEVRRDRPLWELQRLLDGREEIASDWLVQHVDVRGGLSLEHTFRLLSLVLDREAVGAAYQGILADDPHLRSYALEYLEQVLPADLRQRLWNHIGDVSERQRDRQRRPLHEVLSDLMNSRATLFPSEQQQREVRRLLDSDPPPGSDRTPGSEA